MNISIEENKSCLIKGPYYNHSVHLISFGSIWILASVIGYLHYENLAIIFLFAGISLFHSLFSGVRQLLSLCPISSDDPLKLIISFITLSVPLGIIIGFVPFIENINVFFSVFGIIFGVVFYVVAYVYKLVSYFILGTALIVGEAILITVYDNFTIGGFFAGVILILFGISVRIWGALFPQEIKMLLSTDKIL